MSSLRSFSKILPAFGLAIMLGCGGQPSEDIVDGGVNGVSRPVMIGATEGTGPRNGNAITVNGTATPSATIDLYSNNSCSTFVTSALADSSGNFAISVNVVDDTTNVFYAKQTTTKGISACSNTFAVYVEDSSVLPLTLASTPASPANNNSPALTGTTEANATIYLYTDASCTTPATPASGTSNSSGAYSIGFTVADDASVTYYAVVRDTALNLSTCSAAYTYTEDSINPPAPSTPVVTPVGPANNNAPAFSGTVAEAGVSVRLFSDASCATLLASGTADGGGNYNVTVNVADESTTNVYWRSRDAAGNVSVCSATYVTYIEDSGTPAPTISSSSPTSPSTNNTPTISGTAEAGATVTLYSDASCTTSLNSGVATGGTFNINITVPIDTTTTIYAKAVDQFANVSTCSASPYNYVEDSTAPNVPTLTSTNPANIGNDTTPDVSGNTNEAASIVIYSDSGCTTNVGTGTSNVAGAFTVNVTVGANSTTGLYAKATDGAGNISACSAAPLNYTHDNVAPSAPTVVSSTPNSPSNANNPTVAGAAEANSTVRLYTDSGCTTQIGLAGTATGGGTYSIATSGLTSNATTNFYARATDAAGNTSACSASPLAYVEDSTAPAAGTISSTAPASPSNDNRPHVVGTAEAYGIIAVFADSSCAATVYGTGSANGGGIFNFELTSDLPSDALSNLYLRVTDLAGNIGACSAAPFAYTEDSTAPATITISGSTPASPSNDETPDIEGSTEANAQVFLYSNACTTQIASGTANGAGNFSINVSLANDTSHTIYARAQDAAGNNSACSAVYNFIEDSTAPAQPTGLTSVPSVRSDSQAATIDGTAEANSTVNIYSDSGCTTQVGTDSADGGGVFSASITAPLNQIVAYYASATDVAGNTSACSASSVTYEAYTIPNNVGFFTGVQTNAGATPTNLNQSTQQSLVYNVADYDSSIFTHSLTTNPQRIYVNQAGDYQVSFNVPGTGAVTAGALRMELAVNGTLKTATRAQNFYLANTSSHRESSIGATYVLENLNANDYIEATIRRHGAAGTIQATGKFGVYVEKIDSSRVIFTATAASGLTGGNINSPNTLAWTSSIKDSGFTHTNGDGGITLDSVGTYVIHANIPATGAVANASVKVVARINGTNVTGAEAKQGYIGNASGQTASSMHWSGLITTTSANSVLTFGTAAEAAAGVIQVPAGYPASVFVERLSGTNDVFYGQGTTHAGGTDFNAVGPNAVLLTTENIEDGSIFTHDTATNSDRVTVTTAGDYLLLFNAQNTGAGARVNTAFRITVNGTPVSGAEAKSLYLRNTGGHAESSGTMVYLLRRLNANDIVRVTQARNTTITTATTNQNTSLVLIRKP